MVFLTKETSQDIIFTSEWLLLVDEMGFQQKKIFLNNLSFFIKEPCMSTVTSFKMTPCMDQFYTVW